MFISYSCQFAGDSVFVAANQTSKLAGSCASFLVFPEFQSVALIHLVLHFFFSLSLFSSEIMVFHIQNGISSLKE